MDVRNMEYIPDACFDVIVDKGYKLTLYFPFKIVFHIKFNLYLKYLIITALFDCLLCTEGNFDNIQKMLREGLFHWIFIMTVYVLYICNWLICLFFTIDT